MAAAHYSCARLCARDASLFRRALPTTCQSRGLSCSSREDNAAVKKRNPDLAVADGVSVVLLPHVPRELHRGRDEVNCVLVSCT